MAQIKNMRIYQDKFINLYKDGMSIREIANKYDLNKNTVSKYIKEKMELRPKASVTKEQIDEFYTEYQKGKSLNKIAKEYGLSYTVIRSAFAKHYSISGNGKKQYSHLLNNFISEYQEGSSLGEISDKYGISKDTINRYLMEAGVDRRSYAETSRVYNLNEFYLDELTDEKSYELGMIFGLGNVISYDVTNFLMLQTTLSYSDLILEAIKNFSDKDSNCFETDGKSSAISIRIYSEYLINKLSEYGFGKNTLNIEDKYLKSFFNGYFKCSLSINQRNIYIGTKNISVSILENYLGINVAVKSKTSCVLERVELIELLIQKHPEVKEKIKLYIETNNDIKGISYNKWLKLLNY